MLGPLIVISIALLFAFAGGVAATWLVYRPIVRAADENYRRVDEERKLFLDHLTRAGFGVPMFSSSPVALTQPDDTLPSEEDQKPPSAEAEEESWLGQVSRNPAKLAARVSSLMWKRHRDAHMRIRENYRPEQVKAALDEIRQAEEHAKGAV